MGKEDIVMKTADRLINGRKKKKQSPFSGLKKRGLKAAAKMKGSTPTQEALRQAGSALGNFASGVKDLAVETARKGRDTYNERLDEIRRERNLVLYNELCTQLAEINPEAPIERATAANGVEVIIRNNDEGTQYTLARENEGERESISFVFTKGYAAATRAALIEQFGELLFTNRQMTKGAEEFQHDSVVDTVAVDLETSTRVHGNNFSFSVYNSEEFGMLKKKQRALAFVYAHTGNEKETSEVLAEETEQIRGSLRENLQRLSLKAKEGTEKLGKAVDERLNTPAGTIAKGAAKLVYGTARTFVTNEVADAKEAYVHVKEKIKPNTEGGALGALGGRIVASQLEDKVLTAKNVLTGIGRRAKEYVAGAEEQTSIVGGVDYALDEAVKALSINGAFSGDHKVNGYRNFVVAGDDANITVNYGHTRRTSEDESRAVQGTITLSREVSDDELEIIEDVKKAIMADISDVAQYDSFASEEGLTIAGQVAKRSVSRANNTSIIIYELENITLSLQEE